MGEGANLTRNGSCELWPKMVREGGDSAASEGWAPCLTVWFLLLRRWSPELGDDGAWERPAACSHVPWASVV